MTKKQLIKEVEIMAKGSKFWADSYVVLKNGETIYIENDVDYIEEQMKLDSKKIVFDIAAWIRDEIITIKKQDIMYYAGM